MKKKLTLLVAIVAIVTVMTTCLAACDDGGDDADSLLFGKELLALGMQYDILSNLTTGSVDIGVLDSIMAGYYMMTGSYSSTLQIIPDMNLSNENYGIAAKKNAAGAGLIKDVNDALIALAANGEMATIANTYGIADKVVVTGSTTNPLASTNSFWSTASNNTTLVIGYTEFAPIAFKNSSEQLVGYDIDLAKKTFEYLNNLYSKNITVEFLSIKWEQKESFIENGTIHLLWNGMTINDERTAAWNVSVPYLKNEQACIIRKADASKYATIGDFLKNSRNANVGVEKGSAAHDLMLCK